jgi:hypothetical protein
MEIDCIIPLCLTINVTVQNNFSSLIDPCYDLNLKIPPQGSHVKGLFSCWWYYKGMI